MALLFCPKTNVLKSSQTLWPRPCIQHMGLWEPLNKWVVPKKIYTPPTEEVSAVRGGERGIVQSMPYICIGCPQSGVLLISSLGGMDLFWNDPIRPNVITVHYSLRYFLKVEIKFSSVTNASTLTSIQNIKFKYTARQCLFINLHVPQRHQFLPLNWLIAVVVSKNEIHWAACKHTKVAKFNFYYHIFQ